jgi:hypothetical protein
MKLRYWLPTKQELWILWVDIKAVLAGDCNREIAKRGGYAHWRCALRRGHDLPHRFNSYTWAGPGANVEYDPLPFGVHQPAPRTPIYSGSYFHRIRSMREKLRRIR